MFNFFVKFLFFLLFFTIFCFICIVFVLYSSESISTDFSQNIDSDFFNSNFIWPLPGYSTITSYYGSRVAPTNGAGSFHSGIDIGATPGVEIVSSFSGKVIYAGFLGANGYSIQISNGTYLATYSHVSPYFLVYVGQYINQGDVIATVGPKNVYDVPNNPYKDSNGNPTNRCHHWTTSSFFFKSKWNPCQSIRIHSTLKKAEAFLLLLLIYLHIFVFILFFMMAMMSATIASIFITFISPV